MKKIFICVIIILTICITFTGCDGLNREIFENFNSNIIEDYNGLRKLDNVLRKDSEPDIIKLQEMEGKLSMKKRTFSGEFKAKVVLEVLRGEKELSIIAQENEIAPNQIRKWKSEFIENAALIFNNKKEKEYKERALIHEQETDRLYKTIGQLTTQVDWLKKKSTEVLGSEWESKFTTRP